MWVRLLEWMIADAEPPVRTVGSMPTGVGVWVRGEVTTARPESPDGIVEIQGRPHSGTRITACLVAGTPPHFGRVDDAELDVLLRNERYPRSAGYSARWMVDAAMGPNPVWQAEALTDLMPLEPGMRILDMGCGTALSSIFLAKEFGVEVWATDLWVKPDENLRRAAEAHVEDQVHPIYAEAHALPFAEDFFDALISIGAYHYFGTDDLYLGYYSRFVKRGGQIGIVQPGLADEYETLPPPHLEPYWKWDFCAWHSPAWWRRHWEKTGLVTVEVADRLPDGWRDWLQWNEACDHDSGTPGREEAQMLRTDGGRTLGLSRVTARRNS